MKLFVHSLSLLSIGAVSAAAVVPGKAFDRFLTIWLENQDFFKVSENPDIQILKNQGILLTSFYGLTHPSQPNYIASVGGDYFGLDTGLPVNIPSNVSNIVDLFDTRQISWKAYMEAQPGPGFTGEGAGPSGGKWEYYRKHNPLISYENISGNKTRRDKIQPLDDFESDVRANTLPQWAHLSPSIRNDGHDTGLSFTANWTRQFLEPLLNNSDFMEKTLVLLTFDESEGYQQSNRVLSLLFGGAVPRELRNTTDDTFYTHYSMLSTMEANWDLPNLGRFDVGANVFDIVAKKSGYKNVKVDTANVLLNVSYPGFLASKKDKQAPLPAPNLNLTGAGGKGVLQSMKDTWKSDTSETYYNGSIQYVDGFHNLPVYVKSGTSIKAKTSSGETLPPSFAMGIFAMGTVLLFNFIVM
ncbi:MAG: hypothetical protein M1814_006927 [Vezdaea aestivalis]|nr:MAG: hypothetical protein M1814_006927 [Vezdaea aestivalis]